MGEQEAGQCPGRRSWAADALSLPGPWSWDGAGGWSGGRSDGQGGSVMVRMGLGDGQDRNE